MVERICINNHCINFLQIWFICQLDAKLSKKESKRNEKTFNFNAFFDTKQILFNYELFNSFHNSRRYHRVMQINFCFKIN